MDSKIPVISQKRYKGFFYNTAPLGMGHLIRSINLITPDFLDILSKSSLAVNLSGGGTLADILTTKTPALIFAHPGPKDQLSRAIVFHNAGIIRLINPTELEPLSLKQLILETIQMKAPDLSIDTMGTQHTTQALLKSIKAKG